MALQLRVVGASASRLGDQATRVFGIHGGQIGRAPDNDWVLPDDDRYVSGYHATVTMLRGRWVLTDRSSNGTYLNGQATPLPSHTAYALKDGDRLRIGDYDILVRITPEADFPPSEAVPSGDGLMDEAYAAATHGALDAELDLSGLIAPARRPGSRPPVPVDLPARSESTLTGTAVERLLEAGAEPPPPPPAPRRERAAAPAVPRGADRAPDAARAGAELMLRSAGLDPARFATEDPADILTLAGQVLREMTLGLAATIRAAGALPDSLGDTAIHSHNPLALAAGVNESLERLLTRRTQRTHAAVETVRDGFAEIRRHDQALHVAMREALRTYLELFAPAVLAEQFERVLERSPPSGMLPRSRYWDLYADLYRVLVQSNAGGLPHAYLEHYHRAYALARDGEAPAEGPTTRYLVNR